MNYICPICGKIVNPKGSDYYKIRTRHERYLTLIHKECYKALLKKGQKGEI